MPQILTRIIHGVALYAGIYNSTYDIYEFLLPQTSHTTVVLFWGHFDPYIINPLITMTTTVDKYNLKWQTVCIFSPETFIFEILHDS